MPPIPPSSDGAALPPPALTEAAARRLLTLAQESGAAGAALRVSVEGGGCSGFQYRFALETSPATDDHVFERDGARLVVDPVSLPLLAGSVVDFLETPMESRFVITNPNAKSGCGCGASFALDKA